MEKVYQNLKSIKQFIVCALLFSVSQAKRCGYRVYAAESRPHAFAIRHHQPTEIVAKECTWGCCWDQTYDVCCPFPMEIIVVGVISCIVFIIVIVSVVILAKYLLSRWRTCAHGHTSVCRHGNFTTLVYPCQSTILHQNYIQLDPEKPSPHTNQLGYPSPKVYISKSQEEIARKSHKFSQLIYGTL